MKRAVVAAALAAASLAGGAGCEKKGAGGAGQDQPPPPTGRVDAVKAVAKKPVTVEELCDVNHADPAAAPTLTMPALAAGESAPPAGTWRWINVWATWCVPCTEEMPKLVAWHKDLAARGLKYDLVFVSAEPDDDKLAASIQADPKPLSLRMATEDALPAWLTQLGLGEGAPIPVHVFVDPANKIRCVRAGAVKDTDLPAIKKVLGG